MKIALLFICTGKYSIFWKDFYTSAEQYFVPDAAKEYFVFTDNTELPFKDAANVHVHHQEKLGWPYDTLMRFSIFSRVEKELAAFDYIFFFNANTEFIKPITAAEILPGDTEDGLTVVLHPGYYNKPLKAFPYEKTQKKSTAYMPSKERHQYFQGCLNGGTGKAYLQLIKQLTENTQKDLDNGIIAKWHDESQLNKYVANKRPKVLNPGYAYPEGWDMPFERSILMRDKGRFGGSDFMRQTTTEAPLNTLQLIIRKIKRLFS